MKYFIPYLEIPSDGSKFQTVERLGGLPVGLNEAEWPKCTECGTSQSLLAQFLHHPERLNLGREGRSLLIFHCNNDPGMCATWEAFSGANACLIVEPEDIGATETKLPADQPSVEYCALIKRWELKEDEISEDEANAFSSEEDFFNLNENTLQKATWSTRLGSVPRWLQSPSEAPAPDWHFLGQLDSSYSFIRAPQFQPSWVVADPEHFEGRTHLAQGPNFGGGLAYLFAHTHTNIPRVVMLWQR